MVRYMKVKILFAGLLVTALGACDNTASRLLVDAERCEQVLQEGNLEAAEALCTRALGGADGAGLAPDIRSGRLYQLGRIKRQLSKFTEGEDLLRQSLAIEEELSGPDSAAAGLRLLELSLVLAGQERWEEGARILERALPLTDQLTDKERASMAKVLKHYAGQLEKTGQTGLVSRFRVAAAELGEPAGNGSD
jgi:tetratricopeptide (TPR) repeat protein